MRHTLSTCSSAVLLAVGLSTMALAGAGLALAEPTSDSATAHTTSSPDSAHDATPPDEHSEAISDTVDTHSAVRRPHQSTAPHPSDGKSALGVGRRSDGATPSDRAHPGTSLGEAASGPDVDRAAAPPRNAAGSPSDEVPVVAATASATGKPKEGTDITAPTSMTAPVPMTNGSHAQGTASQRDVASVAAVDAKVASTPPPRQPAATTAVPATATRGDSAMASTPPTSTPLGRDTALAPTLASSLQHSSPAVVTAAVRQVAAVLPAPAVPAGPTLINLIGTLFFTVEEAFTNLLIGPPTVAPGSNVTVGISTLKIPCGDGYTATTDWYFPTNDPSPQRLIYFQHGFASPAALYDVTATQLAQQNDAIVVAPTITGNLFACDGCQLAGDQMHAAVAQLFLEPDRQALLASARAAGFTGTALPQRFVLAGHSEGGGLAAGTAGYFEEFAPNDETRHELAGVLLFDSAGVGTVLSRALQQIPTDIPVLNIAAPPSFFDEFGDPSADLEAARPGQFNGVQLVGGDHSDAFRTSNPFVQFVVSLLTGPSQPQNVQAVQVLAKGWINDMYADAVYDPATRTGVYGAPGSTLDISTNAGTAQAYVLPAPPADLSPIELLLQAVERYVGTLNFASCAVAPGPTTAANTMHSAASTTAACSTRIHTATI